MVSPINAEDVLTQKRAELLKEVSYAAEAAQGMAQQRELTQISDAAFNLRSINTSLTPPLDPSRGRNVDILA